MRYNQKPPTKKQVPKPRHYPSKLITQLMNSDSDQQPQHSYNFNDKKQIVKQDIGIPINKVSNQLRKHTESDSLQQMPPLMTISNQRVKTNQKQNIGIQSNYSEMRVGHRKNGNNKENYRQNNKEIRYNCYKIQGNKIIDVGLYNSLSLQDTSAIKDPNQHYQTQIQKLKQQKKQLYQKLIQQQQENRHISQRYQTLKQQLNQRIHTCQQLQQALQTKQRQITKLNKKINGLELQVVEGKKEVSRDCWKRVEGVNRNFNTANSQRFQDLNQDKDNKKQNQNSQAGYSRNKESDIDAVYGDITNYIVNRVEELKNKLMTNRMSKAVEQIIEQFMAEIVNINPITVSRTCNKVRSVTPSYKNINNDSWLGNRSTLLQRQTRTPLKKQQKQKNQDLRNLQKSLQKLREMQKSYCSNNNNNNNSIINSLVANNSTIISNSNAQVNANSNTPYTNSLNSYINGVKESYNSLDRSYLDRSSGVEVSRSKSRRKRIFQ